jgi:hypothetical protein
MCYRDSIRKPQSPKSWQLAATSLRDNRSDHWIRLHLLLVSLSPQKVSWFYQKPTRVCVCVCGGGASCPFFSLRVLCSALGVRLILGDMCSTR